MNQERQELLDIHNLIATRRSTKNFSPDKPVSRENIKTLLDAARWAPSSSNKQPWRFIVFDTNNITALENARSCLSENNRSWAKNAPILIMSIAEEVNQQGKSNSSALHDLGLANENILLQAISMGLNCHPMGGFDKTKASELFGIPDEFRPAVMIAIGYPADMEDVPEEILEFDQKIRKRKLLSEISFQDTWGFLL